MGARSGIDTRKAETSAILKTTPLFVYADAVRICGHYTPRCSSVNEVLSVRSLTCELLAAVEARLGEAPMWWAAGQVVVSVDIEGNRLYETDGETGDTRATSTPSSPGAVAERAGAELLIGLADGLYTANDWTLLTPIEPEDPTTRTNDCLVDSHGSILVGVMDRAAKPGRSSLYRVTPDGRTTQLLTGLTVSNGMAWMGDQLLHIDTPTRLVRSFRYDPDGILSDPQVFLDLGSEQGTPDGMSIDAEGCVWIAFWNGGAVRRYTPDGDLDTVIRLPVSRPTSCTFGGSDLSTLYITTARPAPDSAPEPLAGSLFACEVDVTGTPSYVFGGGST